jgi:alcohol dehydrogenase class IV
MRTTWRFSTSDEIIFGKGAAKQIGAEARLLNRFRAFVVTDARLISAGVVETIYKSLKNDDIACEIFEGGAPEPTTKIVEDAAAQAAPFKPDLFIGLGGGSNMDVAKVASVLCSHGGLASDYFGENKIPAPSAPVFAVSTTAGTGSEVSAVAVLEDVSKQLKLAVASPFLRPTRAFVDPLLTLSCPPKVTAESGMDALTHAIEAYTILRFDALNAPAEMRLQFSGKNPLCDVLAARAIQLIGANLRTAVFQPMNVDAREAMHLAALMAGMAFSSAGLAAVHALQYPIGAITHTSHGLGNALILPYVVEFLLPSNPALFAEIAVWLGEEAKPERCVDAIQKLKRDIGIPMKLRDIGIKESNLRSMAETAATYPRLLRNSARPLSVDAFEGILRSGW